MGRSRHKRLYFRSPLYPDFYSPEGSDSVYRLHGTNQPWSSPQQPGEVFRVGQFRYSHAMRGFARGADRRERSRTTLPVCWSITPMGSNASPSMNDGR